MLAKVLAGTDNTHSTTALSSPLARDVGDPVGQREAPVSGNEDAADDVDDLDHEGQEAVAALVHGQQDGLDVVLDEDAGDIVVVDLLALLRHGVLVGEDGLGADAVDGGHHGEVVLELVEVGGRQVDGAVEGVDKRGVEGAIRELGDDVREVKVYRLGQSRSDSRVIRTGSLVWSRCSPTSMYPWPLAVMWKSPCTLFRSRFP